jgi:hypothetical protein
MVSVEIIIVSVIVSVFSAAACYLVVPSIVNYVMRMRRRERTVSEEFV